MYVIKITDLYEIHFLLTANTEKLDGHFETFGEHLLAVVLVLLGKSEKLGGSMTIKPVQPQLLPY